MARHDKKGRSKGRGPFVMLTGWMMDTEAWRSLSPPDRAVYIELARLYNGRNNGFLALGARAAAERANINKDTATKCFARLVDRGFIECAQPGGFNTNARKAAEWRLTGEKCDRTQALPTKAFVRWRPADLEHRPKRGPLKSETKGQWGTEEASQVPRFRTYAGGLAGE